MKESLYWLYLQAFALKNIVRDVFCPMRAYSERKPITLPWLWIGAETSPGHFMSVTEIVNDNIQSGINVTSEWLEEVTGLTNVISWKYLDKTLKEVDFPLTGIIIQE
jgi:hypothetical protein